MLWIIKFTDFNSSLNFTTMRIIFPTTGLALLFTLFFCNTLSAQWATNGTNIYNTNSGNVGIGTNSPGSLLTASRNTTEPTIAVRNAGGIGGATFRMQDNNSGADWKFKATNPGGFKIRDNANALDVIVVEPNSAANVIYINGSGYMGVGTASPTQKLDVVGSVNVTSEVLAGGAILGSGDFRGNYLNGVINCGGGNINYSNILSDTEIPSISYAAGDEDLYIEDDLEVVGTAYKTGGGSWTSLSDERYKKNVEDFTEGLAQVMQIRPVSFQYNERAFVPDHDARHIGVLAQDMIGIAPYMVEQVPMGQIVREIENGVDEILKPGEMVYTFNPSALDFLLINAVKEQQQIIGNQDIRIRQLEAENALIRQDLDRLISSLEASSQK